MITLRNIKKSDNQSLAIIIRNALTEFGANHTGTVYYDKETDHLYELFRQELSSYFVAESDGKIVGGGGIFPTKELPEGTCELVKMYLIPEARGIGLGRKIMDKCLSTARLSGFREIYLESMPELKQALIVYEKFGFKYLTAPMGNSGHFGCEIYMSRKL